MKKYEEEIVDLPTENKALEWIVGTVISLCFVGLCVLAWQFGGLL